MHFPLGNRSKCTDFFSFDSFIGCLDKFVFISRWFSENVRTACNSIEICTVYSLVLDWVQFYLSSHDFIQDFSLWCTETKNNKRSRSSATEYFISELCLLPSSILRWILIITSQLLATKYRPHVTITLANQYVSVFSAECFVRKSSRSAASNVPKSVINYSGHCAAVFQNVLSHNRTVRSVEMYWCHHI